MRYLYHVEENLLNISNRAGNYNLSVLKQSKHNTYIWRKSYHRIYLINSYHVDSLYDIQVTADIAVT